MGVIFFGFYLGLNIITEVGVSETVKPNSFGCYCSLRLGLFCCVHFLLFGAGNLGMVGLVDLSAGS